MLEFKKPEISDKDWVNDCMRHAKSLNCEYTFGNIFVWATSYSTEICHYKDYFICRWGRGKNISYSLPIGEGNFTDAINEIINDALSNGVTPCIYGLTDSAVAMLQESFTGKFNYIYDDGYNDYIYRTDYLAKLSGKKYHSKRNHIANFIRNNPDWSFEHISDDNIDECIEMHSKWIAEHDDDEDYSYEFEAVLTALENYKEIGFVGGIIRVNGKVIAYSLGEPQMNGKCFVTHFEKAPADMQGAYAIINREFAVNCLGEYEYVNREEDLGLPGLRKAKQSYYPEILLTKCVAKYNDQNK